MHGFHLEEATVPAIHRALRSGEVSVQALVQLYLDRIAAYDTSGPSLNSVVALNPHAVAEAGALDAVFRREGRLVGPLHGVPVMLKDSIETEGMVTTFGSIAFRGYTPSRDATVVSLLRRAGAIVLGKASLPDFASSWFGHSSASGETLNPYALDRDPGGSSSGTGAAIAANLCALGIGGDTAGSIRVPSSFNCLVGVRVTTGLISRSGVFPMLSFEDTVGPMTRTAIDAALLLDVLVAYDPSDPDTACVPGHRPAGGYRAALREDALEGARLGVLRDTETDATDEARSVSEVVERALSNLAAAGAEIVDPVVVPRRRELVDAADLYVLACKQNWDRGFARLEAPAISSLDELRHSGRYHPLLDFIESIAEGPASPEDNIAYFRGLRARDQLRLAVLDAMAAARVDAIVYPTVGIPAPRKSDVNDRRWATLKFPTNTMMAPHATLPAVTMPAGFTDGGLPVGLELLGRPYEEAPLLALAHAYERAFQPRVAPALMPPLHGEP
jgi:amidase